MSDLKKLSVELNSELEEILNNPDGNEEVEKYLKNYLRKSLILRYGKWFLIVVTSIIILCMAIYYIPILNWNASAIGRLTLIKFVLPYYNWKPLYNSRCLIERTSPENENIGPKSTESEGFIEVNKDDCAVCENLVEIDRISNTSYRTLQALYLSRDNPVIVTDSHEIYSNSEESSDFLEYLLSISNLKYSIPCNIGTNMLKMRDSPKLVTLIKKVMKLDSLDWFLHFRNCEFEAIKASRLIFPLNNRPYFLSSHLPPFRSSWLILSKNYTTSTDKHLPLKDFVLVFQLTGEISGRLTVSKKCKEFCSDQIFKLNAGESLLFNSQMWQFYYHNIKSKSILTITFIQEIEID